MNQAILYAHNGRIHNPGLAAQHAASELFIFTVTRMTLGKNGGEGSTPTAYVFLVLRDLTLSSFIDVYCCVCVSRSFDRS